MDAQQQLFGLMAVAEEHQKAVKAALDGLAAERAALAKERAALAQAAASVAGVAGEVKKAAAEAVPAIQKAAGSAVGDAVRVSLAGASEAAVNVLGEAESKLSRAVAAFGWKWATVAGGAAAGGIVAVVLAAWLTAWWQRHQIESLAEQRQALAAEVAQLQANVTVLEKRGGRIVMNTCGVRLCIEASTNQGEGAEHWRGANWHDKARGVPLVIPRGY